MKDFPEIEKIKYVIFKGIPIKFSNHSERIMIYLNLLGKTPDFYLNEFRKNPSGFSEIALNDYKKAVEKAIALKNYWKVEKEEIKDYENRIATAFAFIHAWNSIWSLYAIRELIVDCLPAGYNIEDNVSTVSPEFGYLELMKKKVLDDNFLSQNLHKTARKWDLVMGALDTIKSSIESEPTLVTEKYRNEVTELLNYTNTDEALLKSYNQIAYGFPGIHRFEKNVVDSFSAIIEMEKFDVKDFIILKGRELGNSGKGASPGKIKGVVKICLTPEDASEKLKRGDILVCSKTDPNWIFFMEKAGGIVTEIGGILSHAAIVARELKVPAIVGVQNATKTLKDGMIVEIDGISGKIRTIEK